MENEEQLYYYPILFGFKPLTQTKEFPQVLSSSLDGITVTPLTPVILNQLLRYSKKGQLSHGFFDYYFLKVPENHPYSCRKLSETEPDLGGLSEIISIHQLEYGARRFIADALLYFPNIEYAFSILSLKTYEEITSFFEKKRVNIAWLQGRKKSLPLHEINPRDRYLISEAACKAYRTDITPETPLVLKELIRSYKEEHPSGKIPVKALVNIALARSEREGDLNVQMALPVGTEEILEKEVSSEEDIEKLVNEILERFKVARKLALENTALYVADRKELDVYVATSMRKQKDFIDMAKECNTIFGDQRLKSFYVRYFDPTLSAAKNHLEKGIVECIMVDCAKVVLYLAEETDTWGKIIEASRALHQGNPLIIYAPPTIKNQSRAEFYRDIHPLTRLIDMKTGVIVGAIVTKDIKHVIELLKRIFSNKMEYSLHNFDDGGICLKECLTSSIVRMQTGNEDINYVLEEYYNK
jgi:hypothetical protein